MATTKKSATAPAASAPKTASKPAEKKPSKPADPVETKKAADKKTAKPAAEAKKPAAKTAAKTDKATAKPSEKAAAKPLAAKKLAPPALPAKYTLTSMSAYLAELKGVSRKEARELLDSVFQLLEAGVLQGERVPVGNLGKVHAKMKPATKARMGRNPLTGEAIKIPAKKATKVPRFTFSKNFKEAVLKAKNPK